MIGAVGVYSMMNTNFEIEKYPTAGEKKEGMIPLLNFNMGPLGGVLAMGYHIHALVIPILQNTSTPARYENDIRWGFFLSFVTYLSIGIFGLYGFSGVYFSDYAKLASPENWPIA